MPHPCGVSSQPIKSPLPDFTSGAQKVIETAIKNNLLEDWTVSAHKDKIKKGDKVILWISGKNSGCYSLAEVTSEAQNITQSKDSHLWKTEDKKAGHVHFSEKSDSFLSIEQYSNKYRI